MLTSILVTHYIYFVHSEKRSDQLTPFSQLSIHSVNKPAFFASDPQQVTFGALKF